MPIQNEELNQFKPGESGNPSGRPRGTKNLSTILREMLQEEIEVDVNGNKEKKTLSDVLVRKLIQKANSGDVRALTEIFDRTEGKAKQEIDQKTEHSGSIDITWEEPKIQPGQHKGPVSDI